jgi:hypothetical protein
MALLAIRAAWEVSRRGRGQGCGYRAACLDGDEFTSTGYAGPVGAEEVQHAWVPATEPVGGEKGRRG